MALNPAAVIGALLLCCLVCPAATEAAPVLPRVALAAANDNGSTEPVLATISGPELQAMMQSWGYRADLETDSYGDPMLQSGAEGVNYAIFFYGCDSADEPRRCSSLTLQVGLDLPDGTDLATVNAWNAASRFGRAYLDDENDPWVEWDILVEDGVTRAHLKSQINLWNSTLASFLDAVDW